MEAFSTRGKKNTNSANATARVLIKTACEFVLETRAYVRKKRVTCTCSCSRGGRGRGRQTAHPSAVHLKYIRVSVLCCAGAHSWNEAVGDGDLHRSAPGEE